MNRKDEFIGIRLTAEELAKLDALANATERDRSKVIRLLLAQAQLRPVPDVALREVVSDAK